MKDLLIEIGVEEMPPSAIAIALDFVKGELSSVLRRDDIETYATPRRLAFYVRNFENGVEREERVVVGPPWSGAFDREGKPTPALEGFLRRVGASVRDVFKYKKGKGEYVAVRTVEKERTYLDILRTRFEEIILSVPFPKRMRWTSSKSLTFSRPIRWLLALYGEEVIDLRVGSLRSGRRTRGHRFLSKGWVEVHLASDYLRVMEENKVIPDVEVRRRMIKEGIEELARREGGEVVIPEGLLDEVTYLVEYPFPVLGRFEERFLELPDRVIITVAAHHQRFFCISKEGKLTNAFIGVSNNEPADDSVKRGYERVLRARLEDALFFYREDLKKDLDSLVPKLSGVLIHPKVGTALEKVERLKRI
ncbi:MAG TPA: glycine--tRNA ligase subunit beta, partial [Aquificaceae bacterium]|nr:glycine--tRNA ligase subunit beta [Aquificaceae bacterium]